MISSPACMIAHCFCVKFLSSNKDKVNCCLSESGGNTIFFSNLPIAIFQISFNSRLKTVLSARSTRTSSWVSRYSRRGPTTASASAASACLFCDCFRTFKIGARSFYMSLRRQSEKNSDSNKSVEVLCGVFLIIRLFSKIEKSRVKDFPGFLQYTYVTCEESPKNKI